MSVGMSTPKLPSSKGTKGARIHQAARLHGVQEGQAVVNPPPAEPSPSRSTQNKSYWANTSFRIKKQKPSKVRYLTKSEIWGISLSVLLSFLLAGLSAAAAIYFLPIISGYISLSMKTLVGMARERPDSKSDEAPRTVWREVTLIENITSEIFQKEFLSKKPSLFAPLFFTCINRDSESTTGKSCVATSDHINREGSLGDTADTHLDELDDTSRVELLSSSLFPSLSLGPKQKLQSVAANYSLFTVDVHQVVQLFSGKLRWVLINPSNLPRGGYNPSLSLELFSSYDDRVFSISQSVGQIVYIPEGWLFSWHCVESDDSTAVNSCVWSQLRANSTDSAGYFHYLQQGNDRLDHNLAIKALKLSLSLSRGNVLVLEALAKRLSQSNQYLAAEEYYREALSMNPADPRLYSALISMLIEHANKDVSDSIAGLLEQAQERGLRQAVLDLINPDNI